MKRDDWHGVMPAMTTCFKEDLSIDLEFVAEHAAWMVDHGCTGIVWPGSLGEGAALCPEEKDQVLELLVNTVGDHVPVIAAISSTSTSDCVAQARKAHETGCQGLMVLPPYAYTGTWKELSGHFCSIMNACDVSCMLYNNPIAYGTDVLPEQLHELVLQQDNLHAVKESSGDIRRVTAIRHLTGDRIKIFVGIDDLIIEGIAAGAEGWIAGLVNAFPAESVRLFDLATSGHGDEADRLYQWFLPLLRLDAVPEFVHLVKLVQDRVGKGSERVRQPRLPIEGPLRGQTIAIIEAAMAARPRLESTSS